MKPAMIQMGVRPPAQGAGNWGRAGKLAKVNHGGETFEQTVGWLGGFEGERNARTGQPADLVSQRGRPAMIDGRGGFGQRAISSPAGSGCWRAEVRAPGRGNKSSLIKAEESICSSLAGSPPSAPGGQLRASGRAGGSN